MDFMLARSFLQPMLMSEGANGRMLLEAATGAKLVVSNEGRVQVSTCVEWSGHLKWIFLAVLV